MENSLVYRRLFFFNQLRTTNVRNRITMIRNFRLPDIRAMERIVQYILDGSINVMARDVGPFRRHVDVFRQIVNPRISTTRKRNSLLRHHPLIPRLLRSYYLNQAITIEVQSGEQ